MAKLISTKEKIDKLIQEFQNIEKTFIIKEYFNVSDSNEWKLHFYLNNSDCLINLFFKKNNLVNILPIGKNKDQSNLLINFLEDQCYSADIATNQFSIANTSPDFMKNLQKYISNNAFINIELKSSGNKYVLESSNGDRLHLTTYANGTVLVQSKPFYVYNILLDFLSENEMITNNDITNWSTQILGVNVNNSASYISELKTKLGGVYEYLAPSIQKTLNSSYILCKMEIIVEDYSVLLAGIFRALEAFLKKVLTEEYGYKLNKNNTFCMFHSKCKGETIKISENPKIESEMKSILFGLHRLYANKRNVYLHVRVNTEMTSIIEKSDDMLSIAEEILIALRDTYGKIKVSRGE